MRITFKNNLGYTLAADIYSAGKNTPIVLFSHGFKSGRHSVRNTAIGEMLGKAGISTFLLDFTGHGESEGTLSESTTDQQSLDLKYALDVSQEKGFARFGLSGSSFGGASALMRTAEDDRVNALVLRYSTMNACFSFARPCYELAQKIHAPTLCVVGSEDHPILEENQKFLELMNAPHDLVVIPGAVHAFEEPEHIKQAGDATLKWFKKYL